MVAVMLKRLFIEKGSRREKILARVRKSMSSLSMGSLTAGSLSVTSLVRSRGEIPKVITKGEITSKRISGLESELNLYFIEQMQEPDANKSMGKDIKT